MTEIYDDIEWLIDEMPIGFSTPDDMFEQWHRATGTCENGHQIQGTAYYWSNSQDMSGAWLERIEYTPCEQCDADDDFIF